ncbi:MAG: glutamine synthetase III [Rivularia sp. (in: Bacteria)]|nr:glutamine synthetase III [Rivularia sp. MS3]
MTYESRAQAIRKIIEREPIPVDPPSNFEDIWEEYVFNLSKMKQCLPKAVFKSLQRTIEAGEKLDDSIADTVASAMKNWALTKGASYYAQVFYPMTNATAEKHDGFISTQSDGTAIAEFSGNLLVQGEPDGSSFPNGGIRSTSEARGYTAWDVTSPAYLMETDNGITLCIPTVFVSWTGKPLDKKTPLLRSVAAMNKSAKRVLGLLGNSNIAPVNSSCGAEQEYFLVDEHFANLRPDLLLAGRTLFGKPAAKGQEFDDHYFGAIPERVQVFMQDVEQKMYRLGIPAKTRHNEVAPAQFEIAPIFEAANVASDHQQLTMTLLRQTAKKHGFICLLHEKPFAGINGSGKHVNWSVSNSTQGNLLDPGDSPHQNLQFLIFCAAVIRGVHEYGTLMRAVIAHAGNDHRLGANEAPPAIMSVYLGSQVEELFNNIARGELNDQYSQSGKMKLGVETLPELTKDAGDRNRTSPFAFTGNRFEFRAVGSSQSVSGPLIALNTILADSLTTIGDLLEAQLNEGKQTEDAVVAVIQQIMSKHGAVIFGGDGYSQEWQDEAQKRGLANLRTTADALSVLNQQKTIDLFEKNDVLSSEDLESRFEVYAEQYILSIEMEVKLVIDIAKTVVYPAAIKHLDNIATTVTSLEGMGVNLNRDHINAVAYLTNSLTDNIDNLQSAIAKSNFENTKEHMQYLATTICPLMQDVRADVDALEAEIADNLWPLPTYQEMLFIK